MAKTHRNLVVFDAASTKRSVRDRSVDRSNREVDTFVPRDDICAERRYHKELSVVCVGLFCSRRFQSRERERAI